MREIKFRFWLDADKKMYKVLSLSGKFPDENFQRVFIDKEAEPGMPTNQRTEKRNALMQFTGLKDKNGKEIYEGDILNDKNDSCPFQIKWHEKTASWEANITDGLELGWGTFIGELEEGKFEIIGNIYSNPDLIKTTSPPKGE